MAPVVETLQTMLTEGTAYVSDGHVLGISNACISCHDYNIPPYLKQSESDVLLWLPHTVLGLKPEKCQEAPWSAGHPTINATKLVPS